VKVGAKKTTSVCGQGEGGFEQRIGFRAHDAKTVSEGGGTTIESCMERHLVSGSCRAPVFFDFTKRYFEKKKRPESTRVQRGTRNTRSAGSRRVSVRWRYNDGE
jgi:hypothetical protein